MTDLFDFFVTNKYVFNNLDMFLISSNHVTLLALLFITYLGKII